MATLSEENSSEITPINIRNDDTIHSIHHPSDGLLFSNTDFHSITSRLDPTICNLIVNYLPQSMTEDEVRGLFSSVGTVVSCKLVKDKFSSVSLGYAFVNFSSNIDASKAITSFDKLKIQNKRLKVSYARPNSPTIRGANVYFSGLPMHYTESDLEKLVSSYGTIINHTILRDSNVVSRGVGFVRFDKKSQADSAIKALNNFIPLGGTNILIVKLANPPKIIQTIPSIHHSGIVLSRNINGLNLTPTIHGKPSTVYCDNSSFSHNPLTQHTSNAKIFDAHSPHIPGMPIHGTTWCLFVYNIPCDAEDNLLYKLFSPFGAIAAVKVIPEKSYGFVNMLKYEECVNAISRLNGFPIGDKLLQVSFKTKKLS